MPNPLVSILINNYNYANYLAESIQSCLDQSYDNIEIIVVDDGSTDNSLEVIRHFGEKVIVICKENGGQASAFNAGFLMSRGDFIFFLDADDFFFSEKISIIINIFLNNPDVLWLNHDLTYSMDNEISQGFPKTYISRGDKLYRPPATSALCYRREILQRILPMPESEGISIGDHYLKLAALHLSDGIHLGIALAFQRIHLSNNYTGIADSRMMRNKIGIKTSYFLTKEHPSMHRFSKSYFLRTLVESIAVEGLYSTYKVPEVKLFFKNFANLYDFSELAARLAMKYIKSAAKYNIIRGPKER